MTTPERIAEIINSKSYKPLTSKQLAKKLSLDHQSLDELVSLLKQAEHSGAIVQLEDGRWDIPERHNILIGRLDKNPRGFGFVMPVSKAHEEDIFVPEQRLGGAMNGDLVAVRYRLKTVGKRKKNKGPSGGIVKILDRAHKRFVGTFRKAKGRYAGAVSPDAPDFNTPILIPKGSDKKASKGDKVLAEITHWPDPQKGHKNALGCIERVLGTENTPETDELAIIHQFDLPEDFPQDVVSEAERIPVEPPQESTAGRRDLTDIPTAAIDPEDAKDRDDALSMYYDEENEQKVVLVHIADVSHYVKPGTKIDEEARKRGLSVYLVKSFIPMIPQDATQQKLSLAADMKKPAKTVELRFNHEGDLVSYTIMHTLVSLDAEMSYKEVQAILDGDQSGGMADTYDKNVIELVKNLDRMATQLRAKRKQRGSVDLDVPEYHVEVGDDGRVSAVSQIERDRSHSLVEEFMLAANVAVAEFMEEKNLPAIYRVHEKPDVEDLDAFANFIETVLKKDIDPFDRGALQQLLLDVKDTNYSEAVNMELLRCMKRAQYSPELAPHFALNFPKYCHFTSPIRRYPDLTVHQILDNYFAGKLKSNKSKKEWAMRLAPIAQHCCAAEERSDKAEREIINLKLLRYLEERGVGENEVFDGVITGVKEFGIFAQLQDFSIEGLVKVNKLKDDYYVYNSDKRALVGRKTKKEFRLGQQVKLRIDYIDIEQRQLDFDLAGD